jgi:hypothetical protein
MRFLSIWFHKQNTWQKRTLFHLKLGFETCRLRRVLTWDHVTKMAKWGVQVEGSLRNKLRNPKEIDTIITAAIIRNLKGVKVSHTLLQFKFSSLKSIYVLLK